MDHDTSRPPSADRIEQYLAGHSSDFEAREVRVWLDADPVRRAYAEALKTLDPAPATASEQAQISTLWLQLQRRLTSPPTPASADAPSFPRVFRGEIASHHKMSAIQRSPNIRWSAMTALVLLLIAVVAGTYRSARVLWSHDSQHTYVTRAGQEAMVELVDGSRITLAPRTQLTVTERADHSAREVSLVGEAHFEIVPDAHGPFAVRTGDVTTRVLGTVFDLRRYADDSLGQVVVQSGKVVTQGRGARMILTAGMVGRFTDSSITSSRIDDSAAAAAWLRGHLVFRDTPVPVMLQTLSRWYGYQFQLADSALMRQHVTTTFTIGETGHMMWQLQRLLSVHLSFQDSVVTLHPTDDVDITPAPTRRNGHTLISHSTEVGR